MSNANEYDDADVGAPAPGASTPLTPPPANAPMISPDMYGSPMQPAANQQPPQGGFPYASAQQTPYGAVPGQPPYQGAPAPMYGQQMYPPGAPYPRMRMAQTSLGIAGFCTSIVGFLTWISVFGFVVSIAALVMSCLGMRQTGGKGLAIAGIVISALGSVLGLGMMMSGYAILNS